METHHTKEPWRLEDPEMDGEFLITDEQGAVIATVWQNPFDEVGQAEANARLMLVAPALLASLEDVLPILKAVRYQVGLGPNQLKRMEAAEATIKRARSA